MGKENTSRGYYSRQQPRAKTTVVKGLCASNIISSGQGRSAVFGLRVELLVEWYL